MVICTNYVGSELRASESVTCTMSELLPPPNKARYNQQVVSVVATNGPMLPDARRRSARSNIYSEFQAKHCTRAFLFYLQHTERLERRCWAPKRQSASLGYFSGSSATSSSATSVLCSELPRGNPGFGSVPRDLKAVASCTHSMKATPSQQERREERSLSQPMPRRYGSSRSNATAMLAASCTMHMPCSLPQGTSVSPSMMALTCMSHSFRSKTGACCRTKSSAKASRKAKISGCRDSKPVRPVRKSSAPTTGVASKMESSTPSLLDREYHSTSTARSCQFQVSNC